MDSYLYGKSRTGHSIETGSRFVVMVAEGWEVGVGAAERGLREKGE